MGEEELNPGFLVYPDGTKVAVAKATGITPANYKYDNSEMIGLTLPDRTPTAASFETTFDYINPVILWMILTGITITNNYLKMHGGVLQRPRQIRKLNRRKGES